VSTLNRQQFPFHKNTVNVISSLEIETYEGDLKMKKYLLGILLLTACSSVPKQASNQKADRAPSGTYERNITLQSVSFDGRDLHIDAQAVGGCGIDVTLASQIISSEKNYYKVEMQINLVTKKLYSNCESLDTSQNLVGKTDLTKQIQKELNKLGLNLQEDSVHILFKLPTVDALVSNLKPKKSGDKDDVDRAPKDEG
jgi:hypothetical protein